MIGGLISLYGKRWLGIAEPIGGYSDLQGSLSTLADDVFECSSDEWNTMRPCKTIEGITFAPFNGGFMRLLLYQSRPI